MLYKNVNNKKQLKEAFKNFKKNIEINIISNKIINIHKLLLIKVIQAFLVINKVDLV